MSGVRNEHEAEKAEFGQADAAEPCDHHYMWHSPAGTSHSAHLCMGCGQPDPAWLDEIHASVTVTNEKTFQGLTLWCGDSLPVHVDDFMSSIDLRDLIQNPTLRAVTIARLRSVADLLDQEATDAE